jgi:signal transduction histidine kinase
MDSTNHNEIAFAIIVCSILFLLLATLIFLLAHIYQKRKLNHLKEIIVLKNSFEQELLQTQIEIQEQTLKTISQEIHDNIGQVLSLTKLTLSAIASEDAGVSEKINTSKTLVNKAIIDLKDISNSLNTDSIEAIGLLKAIENEIELINKTNLKASITVNGIAEKLNPKTELILFRMVQECLNNAIKHSQSKQINVIANYSNDSFELIIADDGIGFNLNNVTNKGLGLKNMQNRVKFINAVLNITSSYNGTEVHIVIEN